jgi:methyl-accepting chemotaxis protein
MVAEKGKYLRTEQENEMLNNSVIAILRAVSQLGKGNLTVKVPVNEDVTGALADAINAMADSTAKTLGGVSTISQEVRSASQDGRETVLSTAKGMNEIRGTIQETGKRIKRLGERSQEISGIVKLIDDIAERTSVLALNANMQAAMAGEAGRGFRVVADEVQRLAERSKEATDQISKLVNTIQTETNDTMVTMDRAIGEVVKGGELAEQAAQQVTHLDELGEELIASVETFTLPAEYVMAKGAVAKRRAA